MMSEISFNIDHGYLEGLVRGFKGGILKQSDYLNLVQCETLEGKRKQCRELQYSLPPPTSPFWCRGSANKRVDCFYQLILVFSTLSKSFTPFVEFVYFISCKILICRLICLNTYSRVGVVLCS